MTYIGHPLHLCISNLGRNPSRIRVYRLSNQTQSIRPCCMCTKISYRRVPDVDTVWVHIHASWMVLFGNHKTFRVRRKVKHFFDTQIFMEWMTVTKINVIQLTYFEKHMYTVYLYIFSNVFRKPRDGELSFSIFMLDIMHIWRVSKRLLRPGSPFLKISSETKSALRCALNVLLVVPN